MTDKNENKEWYRTPLGLAALVVAGLPFLPFTIGGALAYTAYKRTKNPKLRTALVTIVLIPTLFVGSAWAAGIKEAITSPESEEKIEQTATDTSVLSEEGKKDIEIGGQVAGEQAEQDVFVVTRVIDGDTIEIEGGQKIRYIGIDTPETVHPSEPVGCFGQEASTKNEELVGGKTVRLEKDVSETDKYGRLLRYVWVDDLLVNEYLVRQGYAQSSTYPPDVKYQDLFLEAQKEARENNRGLWSACAEEPTPTPTPTEAPPEEQEPSSQGYICNCSKTCSQISSCEEAYFQLQNCGCAKRDGDKDGVPCENLCFGGEQTKPEPEPETQTPPSEETYTCNCSKTCSQMSSCEEAYYQLNVCGCSKRDGDNDGVPCESICR